MPDPKTTAPLGSTDAALGESDAPPSSARTSASHADARPRVSPAVVSAFLGLKETQAHLLAVIRRGLAKGTPRYIVDEILSNANTRALATKARPFDESRMRAWLTTLAVNERNGYFRAGAANAKWLNREAEVEELPPDPNDAPDDESDTPTWLIGPWLEKKVAGDPDDRAVYDLIVEKARDDKSYEELAAARGESVNAITKRVQRFKAKYVPLRRRYNERRYMLLLLLRWGGLVVVVAGLAVAAYLLYRLLGPRTVSPAPAPSASVPVLVLPPPSDDDVARPRPK